MLWMTVKCVLHDPRLQHCCPCGVQSPASAGRPEVRWVLSTTSDGGGGGLHIDILFSVVLLVCVSVWRLFPGFRGHGRVRHSRPSCPKPTSPSADCPRGFT